MKRIIDHIKLAEKKKFFIYFFSFLVFWTLNNLFSNSIFWLYDQGFHLNFFNAHMIPCQTPLLSYILIFEGFRVILFITYLICLRRYPSSLFLEFFVAFFIYDFVAILARIWDLIFPIHIFAHAMLASDGQRMIVIYKNHLDIIVNSLWSIILFYILYRQKKLTVKYLVNRLAIIPFSVPLIGIMILLTHYFIQ